MWGTESPMGLATKGVNTNMGHKALRQTPPEIRKEEPLCLTKWSSREGWQKPCSLGPPTKQAGSRGWGWGEAAPPGVLGLWCSLQS